MKYAVAWLLLVFIMAAPILMEFAFDKKIQRSCESEKESCLSPHAGRYWHSSKEQCDLYYAMCLAQVKK